MTPVVATSPRLDAAEFVARAEVELAAMSEAAGRADWMRQTNITFDTNWLAARANAQITERASALAKEAASYPTAGLDPVVARKLELMKRGLTLPAPGRTGVAQQMADIATRLEEIYATGTFKIDGRDIDLEAASNEMATSRDPRRLAALWTGWHSISPPMKADYARLVALANEGSKELGFSDTGALWRSKYDMPADAFAAETDRLWGQVEPLYKQLHCYTRARLNARYGDAVQSTTGPIRADLLGNMWAQQWGNIYDVVAPRTRAQSIDVTARLRANRYDAVKMVRTGEGFFSSLGFAPLPETFWQRSMITRPQGRDVVCHASAWDIDNMDDIRIKMCTEVNEEDFQTVHHELGHNYYQRAYKNQPFLFKDGANDGFHEAIGDMVGLSITPEYLRRIGLINQVPGDAADTGLLLRMALDKVAFMPFGLLVDKWRWQVYSGRGHAGDLQRSVVEAAHAVSGHHAARRRPACRCVRSGRKVPRSRERAVHALLPEPHPAVPVLSRGLQAGGMDRTAAPLHRVRRQGSRCAVQRDAGDGPVQALAGCAGSVHRPARDRCERGHGLLQAAARLARGAEPRPAVRLVI